MPNRHPTLNNCIVFHFFSSRRSRSPHRRDNSVDRIDKKRLFEIARRNAITMLKNGTLPGVQNLAPEAREKALEKMRIGGKTVDELTEFCKKLTKGDDNGYLSHLSGESDIDADLEKPFHHPFVIKDRGPIVMNIKVNWAASIEKNIVIIFVIFIDWIFFCSPRMQRQLRLNRPSNQKRFYRNSLYRPVHIIELMKVNGYR